MKGSRIGRGCHHSPPFQELYVRLSAHTARAFHYPAKGGNIKWLLRSRFRVLFVKVSPLLQEVFPVEVRVRIQSGAWVSSDFCFREPLEFVLLCLEHPFSVSLWLPLPAHDPPAVNVGLLFPTCVGISFLTPLNLSSTFRHSFGNLISADFSRFVHNACFFRSFIR